ncbi:protein lifeguard 2-like [Battus philenor]|uniref:protein lifeguard 2-like n=1 Tax=Battus philenor TaxID=42288 RepID=UPI0035CFD849
MNVSETKVNIQEDEIIENAESKENDNSKESENFNGDSKNITKEHDQNKQIIEMPIYDISKEEKEKTTTVAKQDYVVAFNYRPSKGGPPRGTKAPLQRLSDFTGAGGGSSDSPLSYDPDSTNDFVRLVMAIVLIMLIMTAGFLVMVHTSPVLKMYFHTNGRMLAFMAMGILFGVNFAISCSPCARYPPCNFVLLIVTVCCMSIIAAQITSRYKTEIILYATIVTAIVVFVCFVLAFSSFDFTSWMLYVIVISTALSAIFLIVIFLMLLTGTFMKPFVLVLLICATVMEVMMLTIELQTILGGRAVQLSEDDYALGAFMVYTSIISIFLKIVQILGLLDSD